MTSYGIVNTCQPQSKHIVIRVRCYDSKLKVLSNELTLVLSDIRELDKVPTTK